MKLTISRFEFCVRLCITTSFLILVLEIPIYCRIANHYTISLATRRTFYRDGTVGTGLAMDWFFFKFVSLTMTNSGITDRIILQLAFFREILRISLLMKCESNVVLARPGLPGCDRNPTKSTQETRRGPGICRKTLKNTDYIFLEPDEPRRRHRTTPYESTFLKFA